MRFIFSVVFLLLSCTFVTGQVYLYSDSAYQITKNESEAVVIQNSLPKGGLRYTEATGRDFVYAIFWTRVINKTATPLELTINFPADSFAIPQTNTYVKLFLPPDPMTFYKEGLFDFGLDVKSFLDAGFHKPSMLQRTVNPGDEYLFYVATLYNRGVDGVVRTGFFLKGKDLFYRITGAKTPIKFPCGKIVLKKWFNVRRSASRLDMMLST